MKTYLIFIIVTIIAVLLNVLSYAQQADENLCRLEITITGFENNNGYAKVAVLNSKETYDANARFFMGFNYAIINNKVHQVMLLPKGEYAFKVYHDENGNDELDTRIMGIPAERYGFSNNARGAFGPPSWEDSKFTVSDGEHSIFIKLR